MSTLPERIVTSARSWRGTRWQHQGKLKGVGTDCANFISEVAREAGLGVEIPSNYKPQEDGVLMLRLLKEHMFLVDTMQAGDVIALVDEAVREPNVPRHLAFVTEVLPHKTTIIHASQHGVREHRMDAAWLRRIHSIWRLKS